MQSVSELNGREFLSKLNTEKLLQPILVQLGVEPGKTVLIHSAFSGLSRQGFLAEYFLENILNFVGNGTLAFPTLSWREVSPTQPFFSEQETGTNVGVLTEIFRLQFADRRSIHPTHSVASVGANTDFLLKDHHKDVCPCSEVSPWGRLAIVDAQILLMGVDMDNCTLIHHLEETWAPELYLRESVESYICKSKDSSKIEVNTRRHRKLFRNFYKFREKLYQLGALKKANLNGFDIYGFKAKDLVNCVSEEFTLTTSATLAIPGERSKWM